MARRFQALIDATADPLKAQEDVKKADEYRNKAVSIINQRKAAKK